ncbi:MAG: hypothetical protein BGP13_16200 [Sphingobacteriales bacterium 40-81]|nr:MAG: hypothetical protein BGP13_16200 [Sphingobacteriales bacterium 40-81]
MGDIKIIANKYLESASKLQDSSIKFIIGFSLLVLFCWAFAEQVFYKTKYEAIRLNKLEQKIGQFKNISGGLSKNQQNEYDSLKKKISIQDSVNAETYKAVEENIPPALKFLLKQATKKPFGILLTSLTTLFFLIYLFNLRRTYLSKLSTGLRIIKEEEGYNKIFDYNIAIPFWASPIPLITNNEISKSDLLIIGGLTKKRKIHYLSICFSLSFFLLIQARLYFISLITNSYNQSWVLIVQAIALLFSVSLILIWLLPSTFQNSYNNEQRLNPMRRRNFITTSSFLISGLFLGVYSKTLSDTITGKMLKPRFKTKKRINKITDCRTIELRALESIKQNKLQEASEIIYSEISKKKKFYFLKHYIRLFDLLILLCYKEPNIYNNKFKKTIGLAKQSNNKILLAKARHWEHTTSKEIKHIKSRKYWDKNEIA